MERITELFSGTKGKDTYIKEAKKAADIVDHRNTVSDSDDPHDDGCHCKDTSLNDEIGFLLLFLSVTFHKSQLYCTCPLLQCRSRSFLC